MKKKQICKMCFESPADENSFLCKDCLFACEPDNTDVEVLIKAMERVKTNE